MRAHGTRLQRYVWIILFLFVLVTPLALRVAVGESRTPTSVGKNTATLVVVTPNAESIRSEFADAFSAWHEKRFGKRVFVDYRIYERR